MGRTTISAASPLEQRIGFARAVRVGPHIAVSGTAPLTPDGTTACPDDLYGQTRRCLEIALDAVREAGGQPAHVMRTRVYLTDITHWREAARAHGEGFADTPPACTFVQVSGFIGPDWLVEIELDAIVTED